MLMKPIQAARKHQLRRLLPGLVLALTSCAGTAGDITDLPESDNHQLTEPASPLRGGSDAASRAALDRAATFCRTRGLALTPVGVVANGSAIQQAITGPTAITLRFRCEPQQSMQMNIAHPAAPAGADPAEK